MSLLQPKQILPGLNDYVLTTSGSSVVWASQPGTSSGSCISDLYTSNIHSCSPLNINPLDEGNVYFGSTSAVTVDLSNNYLGVGTSVPSARLHVKGEGSTNATNTLLIENSSSTDTVILWDNGQLFTGAGGAANTSTSFGQYHRSTNFATGFAFYGSNNSNYAMNVQGIGGTKIGLNVGHQNNPAGITEGVSSSAYSTSGSNNYGVHGLGRNGTSRAIGVYGETGGGASISSSSYVAGVYGHAHSNLGNVDMMGGRFQAGQDNTSITYTNVDFYGVLGIAQGSTNTSSTGIVAYGGKFENTSGTHDSTQYGIHSTLSTHSSSSGITAVAGYFSSVNNGTDGIEYAIIAPTNTNTSGFGTSAPTDTIHINGVTGSTQFRLEKTYTPTSSGDTAGNIGSVAWDDTYWYQKTNTGWGRIMWDYSF